MSQFPAMEDEFEEFRARSYSGGVALLKRGKQSTHLKVERTHSLKHSDSLEYPVDKRHLFVRSRDERYKSEPHVHFDVQEEKKNSLYVVDTSLCSTPSPRTGRPRFNSMPAQRLDLQSLGVIRVCSFNISLSGRLDRGPVYIKKKQLREEQGEVPDAFNRGPLCMNRRGSTERYIRPKPGDKAVPDQPKVHVYSIGMVGDIGVGKNTLLQAFKVVTLTPHADDDSEKYVSILLDGEESTLEFVDLSDQEVDSGVPAENIDAYVVVYSVEDSKSFQTAIDRLGEIREDEGREVAVILVANKSDLVRTRVIFEDEGKNAAKKYDCKYIEVSAAIDHKIDELLVGILKQIRLINDKYHKRRSKVSSIVHHVTGKGDCCPMGSSQSMLGKIFGKPRMTSKSCDNLYVL